MSVSVVCPGALSYDASSYDQQFRLLTKHYGLYSLYTHASDPDAGQLPDTVNRRGRGRPGAYCQRSGNFFPEERLRVDGLGRVVGDIFYTTGDPAQTPDVEQDWLWP